LVASLRAGLAVRPNAPAQALAQFEGVVRLWPDVPDAAELTGWSWHDLLVRSAELASLAGANLKARDLVGRALDEVDRAAAPVRAAVLLERFGRYCWLAGVAGARDAREEAVALVAGLPASVEHATVLAAMAQDLMLRSRYRDAIGYARRARDMADGVVAAHAADTLGVCLCMDGQEREGLDLLRWALTAATGLGDAAEIGRAYLNLSEMLTFAGRFAEALRYGQEGVEVTRKLGLTGMFTPFIQGNVVRLLFRLGRWDDAAELAAEVLDGAGENWPRVGVSIPLAAVRIRRGQLDEAQRLLDDVAPLIDSVQAGYSRNEVIRRRCELAIARRDWDRARAAVREGLEVSDTTMWEPLRPVLCALGVRIEADALQEARLAGRRVDHAAAVARADRLLADCAEDTAGYALLARAERTRLDARPDPLAWAEVVRNRDAASDSYQAAYARWRQAEALLACRSPRGGASPFLREARLMAVGLGAAPLVAEVDALAARAGVDLAERRVPVDRPVARLGLTQREAEVLSLLGRGLTNGDIARALFISTKTASVHVSAILRKLGVASRTQAAAYAGSEVAGRRI
jgi:ATP/maltotriose-dependent transcriptional regulator MalT